MTAQFVDLANNPQELGLMLVEAGLAERAERPEVTMLTGGVSSSIFRVRLKIRDLCVKQCLPKLKVQKDWYAPVERVFAEAAWLQVAEKIVPGGVPQVLAVDRARGAFMMEYLAPEQHRNWKTELLAGRIELERGTQIGGLLGELHAATAGNPQLEVEFAHDRNFYALRLEPYLVESARVHPDLASRLMMLVETTARNKLALVHGDVSPKNMLLAPDRMILLDAETAWYGDPAFDLAFLLNHLLLKAVYRARDAELYFATFDAIRAAYFAHVNWEPPAAFERRTSALLPGLMLGRVDGKSPVEYLDDESRQRVRAMARELVANTVDRLDTIKNRVASILR